jgi:transposase
LLFEAYERTGDVLEACRVAHVGRRTFYYWLPRFREGGYEALEKERSRAPHRTRIPPLSKGIVEEIIVYKREHPQAGYRSIANALRKAHSWQAVVGPTKVRDVLIKAGLVTPRGRVVSKEGACEAVHAPWPDQTVNIDLFVVPASHSTGIPLEPVSLTATASGDFSPTEADGGSGRG